MSKQITTAPPGESITINKTIPSKQFKDIFVTDTTVGEVYPTLEQIKKEWEEAGYELINDYCSDFHFVKKIENTIYNRPIYHHFVIEKINGGRCIPYSSFEKDDSFKNRKYFIITFQEHELITKTFKALKHEEFKLKEAKNPLIEGEPYKCPYE